MVVFECRCIYWNIHSLAYRVQDSWRNLSQPCQEITEQIITRQTEVYGCLGRPSGLWTTVSIDSEYPSVLTCTNASALKRMM